MYEQSHRDYSALLSASSSARHGLLIITVDNAITYKVQRDKNARELKRVNAVSFTRRCVSVMLLRRCKIHEGVTMLPENDALRDDALPLVVVG